MRTETATPKARRSPAGALRADQGGVVSAWLTDLQYRWDDMLQGARMRRFAKDETLFLEGQLAATVYVIFEGRVRLTSFGFDGHERHLMIVGPNGLVGDCAITSDPHYAVSAVAAADASVAMVPASRMLAALARYPALAAQQRALSGLRFRIMLRHVAVQGSNAGRRKVCLHLLDLMRSYGTPHRDGTVITIGFTQQEMGSICGLSRVSVSHVFTELLRDQVISRAGRLIVVRNPARLDLRSRS